MSKVVHVLALIISVVRSFHYFDRISSYDHVCNPMDYGAKGDGKTNDTEAIQKAINSCYSHGSSAQILFPSDATFLTGPLSLQTKCSNCAFTISSDATVLVSNDRSKWPDNIDFLTVNNLDHFVFEGPGTIDGQGLVWWQNRNDFRPKIMDAHATHVVVTNILIKNCPNHCLEMETDYTEVFGLHIENPPSELKNTNDESHNTDGIDVHGKPFYIHDTTINTGDDNVAMHSNDTLVKNCNFGSGHGASIGSLSGVYLTNITVENIIFSGTTQAARIKVHNNSPQGKLWNVVYKNLTMTDVSQAIVITEYYDGNKNETCKFLVEDITFEDIKGNVNDTKNDVGSIQCQPSIPCKNIILKDIKLSGGKQSWQCNEADVTATDVTPKVNCIN